MSFCKFAGYLMIAALVAGVLVSMPDLRRYLKIEAM